MKALKYDLITNAKKSLLAGCNLVLYCAGNYEDSYKWEFARPTVRNPAQPSEIRGVGGHGGIGRVERLAGVTRVKL